MLPFLFDLSNTFLVLLGYLFLGVVCFVAQAFYNGCDFAVALFYRVLPKFALEILHLIFLGTDKGLFKLVLL